MKILRIILLLIICYPLNNAFPQMHIKVDNEHYFLKFKILETPQIIGKYIYGNIDSLGFKSYDGGNVPFNLPKENRMITLRAMFTLDKTLEGKDFAMVFPPVFFACNIYLNGKIIEKRGNIENGYTNRFHSTELYFLSKDNLFFGNEKTNEIAIELLTKYGEIGSVNGIFISGRETADSYTFWRNTFSISFLKGMVIASFLIFLYFLILYFSQKKLRKSYYLPFAFVCLFYSFSYINNVLNYDFSNVYILEKITRICIYFWTYFTLIYILEYTKIINKKHFKTILISFAIYYGCLIFISLFQNNIEEVISFFSNYGVNMNFLVTFFYLSLTIAFFIRKRNLKAFILMLCNIIVIISSFHDTYYFAVLLQKPYLMLLPYAMFITIIAFFFILAWEQSEIYKFAQRKSEEFEEINKNLENMVIDRTKKGFERELQFRSIFENSANAIFLIDKNGKYITINPAFTLITGYTLDFFNDKPIGITTHPDDSHIIQNYLHKLLTNEIKSHALEVRIKINSGNYIWINLHATNYFNSNNEFEYILGNFNNITDQKEAQLKIEESEKKHRFIVENINDVIWIIDVIDRKFKYISPSVEKLRGFTVDEVMNQSVEQLLTPDSHKAVAQIIEQRLSDFITNPNQKIISINEIELPCKNGKTVWTETHLQYHLNRVNGHVEIFGVSRDITSRKETENKFRAIFEQAAIGVALLNTKTGQYVQINQKYCDFLGYSMSEMLNKSFMDITYPEDIQRNKNINNDLISGKLNEFSLEKRYIRKDGKMVWGNLTVSPLWKQGEIPETYYHIAIVQDITNRKHAEEQITREREQFLSLLNAIPEPVYVSDFETSEILFANDAKRKIFGENLNGKKCYHVFNNSEHPCSYCQKVDLLNKDTELLRWENYIPAVKKHYYNVDKLIIWQDGRKAKFQISFDLTDLKKAEQLVNKLSVAVEQNPATIVITDTTGNIEYANPHFTQLTGYTFEEAKGHNPRVLKSGKTDEKIFKELWETISKGKIWKGEFINKKKNGEEFFESALISPIFDEAGTIINYLAIKEDITITKNQELEIKKYLQELKELNATKDKFFSIIAHDLKTPFNTILGFADLLVLNMHKYSPEKTLQFVHTIYDSAKKAYKLLENLLEWARSQTGRIEFRPQQLILENLFIEAANDAHNTAAKKNISIINELNDSIELFADRNMLNTILRNLISNAIKFTPADGEIRMSGWIKQNEVHISIKDNGVGIEPEEIDKLFNISEKISTQGTDNEPGTGLGLILCKEFIEKHGGKIWAESQKGKGCNFIFTIPHLKKR